MSFWASNEGKLINGDASVIRCEDVGLMNEISFNGNIMTWKQFKQYWETKPQGSWRFDDLSKQNNKQLFQIAWDIAGEIICRKFEIKFVKSNALQQQQNQTASSVPIHYIFALDDSGSMSTQKWLDLMVSYKAAIDAIRKITNSQTTIKVSVLIQGSSCIVFQENVTPNAVNLNINPRYGGNNFADTFGKAYTLMTKYVGRSSDSYPSGQTNQIRTLKNANPGKIEYYGIEFQTSGDTMKLISKELDGSNKISYNVSQLTSTYLEIINRKI